MTVGSLRLTELPTRPHTVHSRSIYIDPNRTFVVKVEHSVKEHRKREPYQCWNEYVLWNEGLAGTYAAEWVVPTTGLSVHMCPVHDDCVITACMQEYADDGWPDAEPASTPQEGELSELLSIFPALGTDVHGRMRQQVVYCRKRQRFLLVDYGYHAIPGMRLESRRRPDGFWAWVRRRLGLET